MTLTRSWARLSLRARLLVIGVLGVAVALAIGSFALYGVLTLVSFRTIDDAGQATVAEVADLVDRDRLPDPIPVTGSQIVQVLDSENRVVSASVNGDRLTALLTPDEVAAALNGDHPQVSGSRVGLDSSLRVSAAEVGPADARRTVVVAQRIDDIEDSQRILRLTLLATYPLLLLALALIAWRVVGAALRPVEMLRSTADRISGTGQDSRLPVPASRDEVHALAVTLNSMLDRLSASRARQRAFVADAAHELRSPLSSMQTQLEVAERLGEDTETTRDLHAEVIRMSALVEDLLVLARLDQEPSPAKPPQPVAVPDLLLDVVRRQAGARVGVTTGALPDAVVLGDRDALGRVFGNLVDNAVRHAVSTVHIEALERGSVVDVLVSDDGTGIPEADRERVFDRFTRLDEARDRDAGGSGLGLAIVRELVHQTGGTVVLETGVAGGLVARVSLPVAPRSRRSEGSDAPTATGAAKDEQDQRDNGQDDQNGPQHCETPSG
jgi:signal transduction histidine kinase